VTELSSSALVVMYLVRFKMKLCWV